MPEHDPYFRQKFLFRWQCGISHFATTVLDGDALDHVGFDADVNHVCKTRRCRHEDMTYFMEAHQRNPGLPPTKSLRALGGSTPIST